MIHDVDSPATCPMVVKLWKVQCKQQLCEFIVKVEHFGNIMLAAEVKHNFCKFHYDLFTSSMQIADNHDNLFRSVEFYLYCTKSQQQLSQGTVVTEAIIRSFFCTAPSLRSIVINSCQQPLCLLTRGCQVANRTLRPVWLRPNIKKQVISK